MGIHVAYVAIDAAIDGVLEEEAPDILCSAFVDPCLERGLTIHEGGSKYDFVSGLQVGIANLGNALAAVKTLVFDEKSVDPAAFIAAMAANWAGPDGEAIRTRALHGAPKFGNDDDEVESGPDPVEAKKRFTAIKRQYNKTEKVIAAKGRSDAAATKEMEKLGELFKFLKLTPRVFDPIADTPRNILAAVRDQDLTHRPVYARGGAVRFQVGRRTLAVPNTRVSSATFLTTRSNSTVPACSSMSVTTAVR